MSHRPDPEPSAVQPQLGITPIAQVVIANGEPVSTTLYAPGLPDGEHDLFPVPLDPRGAMQPFMTPPPPPDALSFEDGLGCAAEQIRNLTTDAERYRWLRDEAGKRFPFPPYVVGFEGADLDAAIDAARAAEAKEGGQ